MNKMSYRNVYGTDEYNKYIAEYMHLFDEKYLTDEEIIKLSEGFSLRKYIYDDKVEKCVLTETFLNNGEYATRVVYEYKSFYSHSCSVEKIIRHSNGHRYFPFHTDLYGISYLDIDTMEVYNYIPEGYTHLYPAPMGESFIITDVHYDKKSDLIAYDGCYWACPNDVMVEDFSNPLNFNPHLINLHYIFDPDYDVYDDICFKEWKDGRLYVMCDFKTEKSISTEELKELLRKQV